MSDDLLERATSALRETTTAPAPELVRARERARLLSRARKRTGLRPQTLWQWAAVLLLGFFVSTAMAHVISVQVPKLWRALRQPEPEQSQTRPARGHKARMPGKTVDKRESAPPATAEPVIAPVAPAGVDTPQAASAVDAHPGSQPTAAAPAPQDLGARPSAPPRRPPPRAAARSAPQVQSSAQPAPTPAAAEPADLVLFREAQALHLARDPRAIEAWDAYLRAADHGGLVPEARYNRALCLVRAGRHAEARSALAPFAQGVFGGYRQREAQALLSRLPE